MSDLPDDITQAIEWFTRIYLEGIPVLLERNETSFLSFVCVATATDALSGFRYANMPDEERFARFVKRYFPSSYALHAENLYRFRCRLLHNFCPAHFSLTHDKPSRHLCPSEIGDALLDDREFFDDLKFASEKYFAELRSSSELQENMRSRLDHPERGGRLFASRRAIPW